MRWSEIVEDGPVKAVGARKPQSNATGGVAPLTPAQGRAKAAKKEKATAKLADVRATNAIKLNAAQRNVADT